MKYLILIILSTLFAFRCSKINYNEKGKLEKYEKSIAKNNGFYSTDSIMITCDGIKQKLKMENDLNNNNLLQRQITCLCKAVNEKNLKSINEFLNILNNIKSINPFLSNKIDMENDKEIGYDKNSMTTIILDQKWRGEEIFKKLIEIGDVFGCYRESGLNCGDLIEEEDRRNCYGVVPVHNIFFNSYTSMIRNIDGLSVEEYLQKNISHTLEIQLKREKDICQETLYKEYYEVIKQAYEKGLVALKDYGED
jgi:hypothetical protein